jgi:hypothetical protein
MTAGTKPSNATAGANPCLKTPPTSKCTGTLSNIQRAFAGAYNSFTVPNSSNQSGPITSVSVLTGGTSAPLESTALGSVPATATVKVGMIGFQTSATITPASAPTQLAFGGNQGIGTIKCVNNGNNALVAAIVSGCSLSFTTTSLPATDPNLCTGAGTPASPYTCADADPGSGKDTSVDKGFDQRINNASNKCVNPSYWVSPNTVAQLDANKSDPRLITLMITDYGSVGNGSGLKYPIRHFAEFYVTGYFGDPCATASKLPSTSPSGLPYTTSDSVAATGELAGHFINYVGPPGSATGSGSCQLNSFDQCVEVITR